MVATELAEHRQGLMYIFVVGVAARRFSDGMPAHEKQYGVDLGNGEGQCGFVHVSAVEFALSVSQ